MNPEGRLEPVLDPVECPYTVPEELTVTCDLLTVRENAASALVNEIDLLVVTVSSHNPDPAPDPVLILGSGQGLESYLSGRSGDILQDFLEERDVLFYTRQPQDDLGDDSEIECPEVTEVELTLIQESINPEDATAQILAAYQACRDRLFPAGEPHEPLTSAQAADDISAILTALGIEQVNLVGYRESTQIALQVIADHPDIVRSIVQSGFRPPKTSAELEESFSNAIGRLFKECAAAENCRSAFPNLEAQFHEVLGQIEREPLVLEVQHPDNAQMVTMVVDKAEFLTVLQDFLRDDDAVPRIPLIINQIAQGEGYKFAADLQNVLRFRNFRRSTLVTPQDCVNAWSSSPVTSGGSFPYAEVQEKIRADYNLLSQICSIWLQVPFSPPQMSLDATRIPILILHSGYDSFYSTEFVEAWLRKFRQGQLVVFPNEDDNISLAGSCQAAMVREFLASPNREVDASCVNRQPIKFQTP